MITQDLINYLKSLDDEELYEALKGLKPKELEAINTEWKLWGRDSQQLPPGDWSTWLILAGRGFGKTRTGSETVKQLVMAGQAKRIALVAPTAGDCRDVMVEGESGILSVFPYYARPIYYPSKRRIEFHNGAIATLFSADEPERLRGPQHDFAWCDELCSWRYDEAFDMLDFGLRLGNKPRKIITTTPKPTKLIRSIKDDPTTHTTRGSTLDNKDNLAKNFISKIFAKYEGTRLGRQELYAEILDDNPGALWSSSMIEQKRVRSFDHEKQARRIVVGVDPAVSNTETSDSTGIIVAALGDDGLVYILEDLSIKGSPLEWGQAAVNAYKKYKADRIIAEINQGGDMVKSIIHQIDANVSFKGVRASKGKFSRAEPIAALYEQQRVCHVGFFADLESEMIDFDPVTYKKSPDRMDALVWAVTELVLENNGAGILDFYKNQVDNLENIDKKEFDNNKQKIRDIFKNG